MTAKSILLIHGSGAKPSAESLLEFWREALRAGLARDSPKTLERFDAATIEMVYFADVVQHAGASYDESLDLLQRRQVLDALGALKKKQDFRRRYYEDLPGKTPLKEFAMDMLASAGLSGLVWSKVMPELRAYLADEDQWASRLRANIVNRLSASLHSGHEVMLVSHGFGCVPAYDALWQLQSAQRVSSWVTLGAPLAARYVNRTLLGAREPLEQRYPRSILNWYNVAAEDDYVCHDKTVANDFRHMMQARQIGSIVDYTIYNLSVRYGRSNPHHSAGYLVHPRMTDLVAQFLTQQIQPQTNDTA